MSNKIIRFKDKIVGFNGDKFRVAPDEIVFPFDGLRAYWKFDESIDENIAVDSSGNNYDGTILSVERVNGKVNGGFKVVNGTPNQGVFVGGTLGITQLPCAVSFWTKFDDGANLNGICSFYGFNDGNFIRGFGLLYNNNTLAINYRNGTTFTTTTRRTYSMPFTPIKNKWYHIVANMKSPYNVEPDLYIDNVKYVLPYLAGTVSSIDFTNGQFALFRNHSNDSNNFYNDFVMDEFGVWDRLLTEEEIDLLYIFGKKRYSIPERPFTPLDLSPALWLDASDSSTLFDATTGGNPVLPDGQIARWEDKSGNGRDFIKDTNSNMPIRKIIQKNGLDVVDFVKSESDTLLGNAASLDLGRNITGLTFICIFSNKDLLDGNLFSIGAVNNNNTRKIIRFLSGKYNVGGRRLDADPFQSLTSIKNIDTKYNLITTIFNHSEAKLDLLINGITDGTLLNFQTIGSTTDSNSTSIKLGSNHSTTLSYFNGYVADLLCFQRVLNEQQLSEIHTYLNNKWNLYASKLEIDGNFDNIEIFDTFTFQVKALKPNGDIDTEYNSNITVSLANGNGVLSGTTTKQAVNGIAEFTLTYDTIEKIRIKASATNLSSATEVIDIFVNPIDISGYNYFDEVVRNFNGTTATAINTFVSSGPFRENYFELFAKFKFNNVITGVGQTLFGGRSGAADWRSIDIDTTRQIRFRLGDGISATINYNTGVFVPTGETAFYIMRVSGSPTDINVFINDNLVLTQSRVTPFLNTNRPSYYGCFNQNSTLNSPVNGVGKGLFLWSGVNSLTNYQIKGINKYFEAL